MTEKQLKTLIAYIEAAIVQKTAPSTGASVDLYCAEGDLRCAFETQKTGSRNDREAT